MNVVCQVLFTLAISSTSQQHSTFIADAIAIFYKDKTMDLTFFYRVKR